MIPKLNGIMDEALWNEALKTVLEVRGSVDAPGFDACVASEYKRLKGEDNG